MTDTPMLLDAEKLTAARDAFSEFLSTNEGTAIDVVRTAKGGQLGIKNPWGEEGLVVFLPDDYANLASAMNNVLLPNSFTAVWHKDTKSFEVIWTAYPVAEPLDDIIGRKFQFNFDGAKYECEFTDSSDRLLAISETALPVGVSDTGHRNLQSYHQFMHWVRATKDKPEASPPPFKPLSFWIRSFEWDEVLASRLARHLNFYLTYFDHRSPYMFIWPQKVEEHKPRSRYLRDAFPKRIDAHIISDDILQFWSACRSGDAARKFVYFYRIIEHSSYTYVERVVRLKTRRLLSSADAFGDVRALTDKVIGIVLGSEMDDGARIGALLNDAVEPDLLWREIEVNRKAFEATITFEGGYVLKPLVTKEDTSTTFANGGLNKFATSCRGLRNHLSHGRDRTTLTSITPTTGNFRHLEPWVSLISVAAGQVINYKAAGV